MSNDPELGPLEPLADAVAERVVERLGDGETVDAPRRPADAPPEPWASRIWGLEPETRLTLEQVADALDCSPRQVRRYLAGETKHPKLPASDGPAGKTVKAGDLCRWIKDAERAEAFREAS